MKNLKPILMMIGVLSISSFALANTATTPTSSTKQSTQEYVDPDAADYNRIQNLLFEKYKKYGIKELIVAPSAKNIDVELYTTQKKLSKKTFNKIAKEIANTVRKERKIDAKIGVSYLLQKTPKDDAKTLYLGDY